MSSCPSKAVCPNVERFGEEFYSNSSMASSRSLLIRIRVYVGPALLYSCLKRQSSGMKNANTFYLVGRSTLAATDRAEAWPRGATPHPTSGVATESARLRWHRSGLEELPHAQGQGWRPRGGAPHPRSSGCAGAGGTSGASPCSRSGGVATRKCPLSTVRSSGCALLE